MTKILLPLVFASLMCAAPLPQAQSAAIQNAGSPPAAAATQTNGNPESGRTSQRGYDRLVQEVHHQLVMLPRYSVFDDLRYQVAPDGSVTLMGEVANATLKGDAEKAVRSIEGIEKIDNQIKILPVSQRDDRIRRETFRAIYADPTLSPYAVRAIPPIHIIVENGHVTLNGAVGSQVEKQLAVTRVKRIPDVFDVTDNLQVAP